MCQITHIHVDVQNKVIRLKLRFCTVGQTVNEGYSYLVETIDPKKEKEIYD